MDFNSVGEIFDHIDAERERLLRAVEHLSEDEQHFRPAPGRWSAAQLCEHLAMVEGGIARLLAKLLGKADESGAPRAAGADFTPVSIGEFVELTRAVKLEAPESIRPGDAPVLGETLARLRSSRAALHALRPALERADGHSIRFPHPVWGPINLYQWLLFVGAHESRHLAQIEALKEASDAERGATN